MKNILQKKPRTFIWKTSQFQLICAAIFLIIGLTIFLLLYFIMDFSFSEQWSCWLEAYATGSIILISIAIWINEKTENWKESLPKKLNIYYYLGKDITEPPYCTVRNAPLSSESDIRQWGQSIAKTILNDNSTNIDFFGYESTAGKLNEDESKMEYDLKVYLRKKIPGVIDKAVYEFNEYGCLEENENSVYKSTTTDVLIELKSITEIKTTEQNNKNKVIHTVVDKLIEKQLEFKIAKLLELFKKVSVETLNTVTPEKFEESLKKEIEDLNEIKSYTESNSDTVLNIYILDFVKLYTEKLNKIKQDNSIK